MQDLIKKVEEFNEAFGIPIKRVPYAGTASIGDLRHKLMAEENDEYNSAVRKLDKTQIADALGDMLYILVGTIVAHGMQNKIECVFNEIHRSNMTKLDEDGKPVIREDGKILKGKNYEPPQISTLIK